MLDLHLRATKDRVLAPLAARLGTRVSPMVLSILGAVLCVGAGLVAWQQFPLISVVCWLSGRLLDGLDGLVARRRGTASDFGGIADFLLDTIGYAAVPVGLAAGAADVTSWTIVALLLATFYINSVSLLMLSAVLEKRAAGARQRGETTTVAMPSALIEGTETIILFTVALAVPQWANAVFVVMAIGVVIGIVQRTVVARRLLA